VLTDIINPKGVTMGQLYGYLNQQTKEWTNGIVAFMFKNLSKDLSGRKHWVVFDGPVDSLWIESMNTVLDDNKKLCLSDGQTILLTEYMTMMFEAEDLEEASPATVSRCGMIYMEPEAMGVRLLYDAWKLRLFENLIIRKKLVARLDELYDYFVEDGCYYLRKKLNETSPTTNTNIVHSLYDVLDCFLAAYKEDELNKVKEE
jgi:dynein heavy chain